MKIDKILEHFKILYNEINVKTPISVSYDITKRCNLNCKHCYNNISEEDDYLDSIEKMNLLVDKLAELNIIEVTLCGGEPLISDYILEIVRKLKSRDIAIRIITNGIMLDSYIEDFVELLDDKDVIQISIDEPLHITLDQRYHSQNIKAKVYNNLSVVAKKLENVIANITPTKLNQSHIVDIVTDCADHNAKYISSTPYIPIRGEKADLIKPDYSYLYFVEKKIVEICKKRNINYLGGISGHPCQQRGHIEVSSELRTCKYRSCDAARTNMHISSNGSIFPCVFFQNEDFVISDIRNDSNKILNDFKKFNLLENVILPEKCQNCDRLAICNGGCVGLIYSRTGSILNVDPRCEY
ncbi:radical SAM/SPASM domain-containing protein [Clostridium thermosuccinogenes]|uniref:radical SAM/SPASM domain-containing protein n=1 Tax=Clostridium thermosuccinogenes TaxID=84032 RepID=UPI001374797B|nr:radical SAM protein [Pseudoclostridium thermosuccinogenes]